MILTILSDFLVYQINNIENTEFFHYLKIALWCKKNFVMLKFGLIKP